MLTLSALIGHCSCRGPAFLVFAVVGTLLLAGSTPAVRAYSPGGSSVPAISSGAAQSKVNNQPGSNLTATAQGDASTYAGYHSYSSTNGSNSYQIWNDGCTPINSTSQQDVYFDRIPLLQGTPTPTSAGTPPTGTPTHTATGTPTFMSTTTATSTSTWIPSATPTATPSNLCSNYVVVPTSGATIVPGIVDIGNHCDDCLTTIALPFPVTLYGREFTSARASSNGNLQLADQNVAWENRCLPSGQPFYTTIFPYFDDLSTRGADVGAGIFTGVSGSTPNRTFHIEWRACIRTPAPCSAIDTNFEVRLHEGTSTFEIVYGNLLQNGSGATVGVQRDSFGYTQFSCNSASLSPGMKLTFSGTGGTCPPTPAFTPTSTPTSVRWPNLTGEVLWTGCNIIRLTTNCSGCINAGVGPTHMRLENSLGDYMDFPVPPLGFGQPISYTFNCQVGPCVPDSWFPALPYTLTVDYYNAAREPNETDNTSMLTANVLCVTQTATTTLTNTQTASATSTNTITATASPTTCASPPCATQTASAISSNTGTATASPTPCMITFGDVPSTDTFHASIRCLACRGIISGYADGTFRPNNEVTRGQLAKIVSNAAGFTESPNPRIFEDVPSSNTFYDWINRLARREHMSGYACGGVGEPCTSGMPYFRPFANATRGQTSKIVSNTAGYSEIPTEQTLEDVPPTHTFYREIQRLASRSIMGGYQCGGPNEPCLSGKPYFRPQNDVTRGQSAKIVANTFYPNCQSP